MPEQFLALLAAATVVMGSPGPSTLSVTAVGAAFGFRRSVPYLSGLVLGTIGVLLAVVVGIVGLLMALPGAAPVMTAVSAAYILYLAFRVATAPPLSRQDAAAAVPSMGAGLVVAIANPKAYLAISAVIAGSAVPAVPALATLAGLIVAIHVFWLAVGTSMTRLLRHPVASRTVNIVLAVALVASAVLAVA